MRSPLLKLLFAAAVAAVALVWNGDIAPRSVAGFMSSAEAVIGRPATPVSYAGVARRTTRRAVAVGTAATPTHPDLHDDLQRLRTARHHVLLSPRRRARTSWHADIFC